MMMLSFWSNRESTIGKKTDWPWGSTRQLSMTCQNGFKKRKNLLGFWFLPGRQCTIIQQPQFKAETYLQYHPGPHHQSSRSRLNTVRELAKQTIRSQFIKRAAPSGRAAFLIGGETLHVLLYLPTGKAKLEPLGGKRLMELQRKFKHVGILMVDEKSMEMLWMVSECLIQAMSIKTSILATCPSFCLAIGNNYPLLGIPHSTSRIQRNPGDSTCTSCLTMLSSLT